MTATAVRLAREAGLTQLKVTTNSVEASPVVRVPRTAGRRAKAAKAAASGAGVKSAPAEVSVVIGKPAQTSQHAPGRKAKQTPALRRSVAIVMERVGNTIEVVKVLHSK